MAPAVAATEEMRGVDRLAFVRPTRAGHPAVGPRALALGPPLTLPLVQREDAANLLLVHGLVHGTPNHRQRCANDTIVSSSRMRPCTVRRLSRVSR